MARIDLRGGHEERPRALLFGGSDRRGGNLERQRLEREDFFDFLERGELLRQLVRLLLEEHAITLKAIMLEPKLLRTSQLCSTAITVLYLINC